MQVSLFPCPIAIAFVGSVFSGLLTPEVVQVCFPSRCHYGREASMKFQSLVQDIGPEYVIEPLVVLEG